MANISIDVAIRIMSNVASPISKQLIELLIWGLKESVYNECINVCNVENSNVSATKIRSAKKVGMILYLEDKINNFNQEKQIKNHTVNERRQTVKFHGNFKQIL